MKCKYVDLAGDGKISAAYMSKLGAIGLENLKPGRQCHRMTSKVRGRYDCWSCSHTHALPMTMQNWTTIWELRSGTLSELITVVIILSYFVAAIMVAVDISFREICRTMDDEGKSLSHLLSAPGQQT